MFSFRPTHRTAALGLTALTAVALALGGATVAHAQVLLYLTGSDNLTVNSTGTHGTYQGQPLNNATTSYSATQPVFVANNAAFTLGSGGTITSTGGNGGYALGTSSSGAVAITGGTINGQNVGYGLVNFASGLVTISGGTFNVASGIAVDNQGTLITVSGGTFNVTGGGGYALASLAGGIAVTGGTFNVTNGVTLLTTSGNSIDLFGSFNGLAPGQVQTLTSGGAVGSFIGTLQNEAAAQAFTYRNGGTITLHNTAAAVGAPEPASLVLGVTGGLPLLGLIARRRRQHQCKAA